MQKINILNSEKNQLLIIIFVALVLRLGAAFYLGNQIIELPGTADQLSYHTLATRVVNGFSFTFEREWWPLTKPGDPTAHWSFLYTFFLAGVYKIFGANPLAARIIQALIVGILHPYLAYLLGKKIFNIKVGVLSAGITAIYTYFVYYSATLMTEPYYIIAIMVSIYLSILLVEEQTNTVRSSSPNNKILLSVLFGFSLGFAVLLRQLFLLFIPFLFLWVGFSVHKQKKRSIIPALSLTTLIIVILILPFTIYNYLRFDRFVLLNTNAGYALFWANHPVHGNKFIPILPDEMGSYQELIPREIWGLDEAALDQELLRRGIQFVIKDPIRYLSLSISRIPAYFMFWPSSDSGLISNISRVAGLGLFLPFMIYGMYLSISNKRSILEKLASPISLLLLFIIIYSLIHILTWALIRYRLPIDAILILFAGVALHDIGNRIFSRGYIYRHST